MPTRIDHLVIGAGTLQQGLDHVRERLGVSMPFGGVHAKMGTHNHLMQLGNASFLEVIAINRDIEPPDRPRWFGLDDAFIRRQIIKEPTLLGWVVNTDDIDRLMKQANFSLGKAELITRGNLSWHFGLPEDGRLIAGGMLPYAIEWGTDHHPSAGMYGGSRLPFAAPGDPSSLPALAEIGPGLYRRGRSGADQPPGKERNALHGRCHRYPWRRKEAPQSFNA